MNGLHPNYEPKAALIACCTRLHAISSSHLADVITCQHRGVNARKDNPNDCQRYGLFSCLILYIICVRACVRARARVHVRTYVRI